ncbi:unnamed protein product [Rotaria sp. Silwood1]|nr:unnamed protein product [Rotaria sp. Silwood1]CAF4021753.1 unnamed protein product [Rotaria sp. Silwood1]
MNSFVKCNYTDIDEESPWIKLKYLTYVFLKLDYFIGFDDFENIIKKFFYHIETLRLTIKGDEQYLNACRWEKLICSYMPYLYDFDISYDGSSSFWLQKQWFFTHRHYSKECEGGIFYSTNQYRKDYTFYWTFENQTCPQIQETSLNSVKHLQICCEQATNNSVYYFPNVTQLTIEHHFKTFNNSISKTLNHLLPLKQLTKLIIKSFNFPFLDVMKILRCTSNLNTLRLNSFSLNEVHIKSIQESKIFQYVSNTNQIKNFDIRTECSLNKIKFITNLFPKLQYLKTGMNRKEIGQIIRFLLTKSNDNIQNLFFLCISNTPKICLKEINILIK